MPDRGDVLDHPVHVGRGRDDQPEEALLALVQPAAALDGLGEAVDGGERRAQVVRDRAHQSSEVDRVLRHAAPRPGAPRPNERVCALRSGPQPPDVRAVADDDADRGDRTERDHRPRLAGQQAGHGVQHGGDHRGQRHVPEQPQHERRTPRAARCPAPASPRAPHRRWWPCPCRRRSRAGTGRCGPTTAAAPATIAVPAPAICRPISAGTKPFAMSSSSTGMPARLPSTRHTLVAPVLPEPACADVDAVQAAGPVAERQRAAQVGGHHEDHLAGGHGLAPPLPSRWPRAAQKYCAALATVSTTAIADQHVVDGVVRGVQHQRQDRDHLRERLPLAEPVAAITSLEAAIIRRPETANSRATITIATHDATRCISTSAIRTQRDEQLVGERVDELAERRRRVAVPARRSRRGSRSAPRSRTRPPRAGSRLRRPPAAAPRRPAPERCARRRSSWARSPALAYRHGRSPGREDPRHRRRPAPRRARSPSTSRAPARRCA